MFAANVNIDYLLFFTFSFFAQATPESPSAQGSGGGTLIVAGVALLAGFICGINIWRADRQRCIDAELVNEGLRAQIEELDPSAK